MTTCKSPRKGRRRNPQPTPADVDMAELAAVIAEHQLEQNATGWLRLPWRDGRNAVSLAAALSPHDTPAWLVEALISPTIDPSLYWRAADSSTDPCPLQRAALRCFQVLVADSDGGGHVYNDILRQPIDRLCRDGITDDLINAISKHRCKDAIGVGPKLTNDEDDRLRRAFTTAWSRGLYHAAYSLPQASWAARPPLRIVK